VVTVAMTDSFMERHLAVAQQHHLAVEHHLAVGARCANHLAVVLANVRRRLGKTMCPNIPAVARNSIVAVTPGGYLARVRTTNCRDTGLR
jgi:hypothetical protein